MPPQEVPPVMPRGWVIKENLTRLALRTGSLGLQTASPTATRSVATEATNFTTDMGSLQQWRSIQAAYRIEFQRLTASVRQIAQTGGQDGQKTTERLSARALQGLRDRVKSITMDMDTLN